jgi:hypothetical protein
MIALTAAGEIPCRDHWPPQSKDLIIMRPYAVSRVHSESLEQSSDTALAKATQDLEGHWPQSILGRSL